MTQPTAAHDSAERNTSATPPEGARASVTGWRLVLVLFYGAVALVFVVVVGAIVADVVKNKSLIPPPQTLVRYDCSSAAAPFALYLHGTQRAKISSASGVLEGTLHNKHFDWGSFGSDASQLGFVPPTDISFEDAQTLTLRGPGADTIRCSRAAVPAKQAP